MPFLKPHPDVEAWLQGVTSHLQPLSQREYAVLVTDWRSRFEELLMHGDYLVGKAARRAAEASLPIDGFVFSIPGYRWLPAATDARLDLTFAYRVKQLVRIEFDAANRADALIVDQTLTRTCLCTHEAGVMSYERFCEVFI